MYCKWRQVYHTTENIILLNISHEIKRLDVLIWFKHTRFSTLPLFLEQP